MKRKIPEDAFAYYLALGPARSYAAVAEHYKVSKRAVTKCADREGWAARLLAAERKSRVRAEERAMETLEEMKTRHLQTMQLVQRKALEALRSMPIDDAFQAVRALAIAVDRERLISGEVTERTAVSIEEIVKREYEKVMVVDEDESGEGNNEDEQEVPRG